MKFHIVSQGEFIMCVLDDQDGYEKGSQLYLIIV